MGKADNTAKKEAPVAHAPAAPFKGKAGASVEGACACKGCKADGTQFNFCSEHFEQFKFGLIKKTGEPVPDYEKKLGHYEAYKAKQKVRKAA